METGLPEHEAMDKINFIECEYFCKKKDLRLFKYEENDGVCVCLIEKNEFQEIVGTEIGPLDSDR